MLLYMACDTFSLNSTSTSLWLSNYVIFLFSIFHLFFLYPRLFSKDCCCLIIEFIHYTSATFKSHIDCKAGLHLRGGQGSVFHIRVTPIIFFIHFHNFQRLDGVHTRIGFIGKVCSKRACCFCLFLPLLKKHQGHRQQSLYKQIIGLRQEKE